MADYRPIRVPHNRQTQLTTFQDAINDVLEAFGVDGAGKHSRDARRAVLEAHRDLPYRHRWSYYQALGQIITAAEQTTGTITYDHTGGTYERELTLSGATWPTDARFYRVLISQQYYDIEDYKTSTVVTLSADVNPGADIAAGTTYSLSRSTYPLPMDARKATQIVELSNSNWPTYVNPEWLLSDQDAFWSPDDIPDGYTIRNGGEYYGGLVFEFGPPPSTSRTYKFIYERSPFPLRMFGNKAEYYEGTIAVSGTAVTGTSTAWTSDMEGCIIRVPQTGTSSYPTGLGGSAERDEPYAEQRVIKTVGSATSITLDSAFDGSYTDVRYTIGSPLDIENGAMMSAFQRLSEWAFARLQKERKDVDSRFMRYTHALKLAMGADNRQRELSENEPYYPASLADIARR